MFDNRYINLFMLIEYKNSLDSLKEIVFYCQLGTIGIRMFSQSGFSLLLVLQITQTIILAAIFRRQQNSSQAKFYLVSSLVLTYLITFNFTYSYFSVGASYQSLLVQNFKNGYKTWGYAAELLFRIPALVIMWRAYQLSLILQTNELYHPSQEIQQRPHFQDNRQQQINLQI